MNLDEDKMKQIKDELDWYDSDEKPYNEPYHWAVCHWAINNEKFLVLIEQFETNN